MQQRNQLKKMPKMKQSAMFYAFKQMKKKNRLCTRMPPKYFGGKSSWQLLLIMMEHNFLGNSPVTETNVRYTRPRLVLRIKFYSKFPSTLSVDFLWYMKLYRLFGSKLALLTFVPRMCNKLPPSLQGPFIFQRARN